MAVLVAAVLAGCGSSVTVAPTSTTTSSTTSSTSTTTSTTTLPVTTTTLPPTSTTAEPSTTTTSSTTTTTTTTTLPGPTAAACIAQLAPATRVGQVLLPVVEQAGLEEVVALAERGLVGGVVIIGKPDEGITDAIAALQASSITGRLVIAVDEEGGSVQRLDGLLGRLPSAYGLTELEPRQVRVVIADRAAAMADLGFTVNLAPVLDVGAGPGIGSRSFGDEPNVVVTYGRAFADGVLAGGLVPVAKHFPGHGRASADSHLDLPTTPPFEDLSGFDLLPWRGLTEGTAVMVGHLDVPGLTNGMPASLSPEAIDGLLRTELGFDGVVFTDDLAMGAIEEVTTLPKAAVLALVAGADLLITGGVDDVIPAAWEIVMALDDRSLDEARLNEAVGRAFALRGVDPCTLVS